MKLSTAQKWNDNDKGRVVVEFGCASIRCHTDEPYYFSQVTARFSHLSDGHAVFKDHCGNYATSVRRFRRESEVKAMAEGGR